MRHLRTDYQGIQDTAGNVKILDDEPIFIVRARDPDAAQTVRVWAAYVYNRGGDLALVRAAQWWADEMERYAAEHFPQGGAPRVADVDESLLIAPASVMHPDLGSGVPRELMGAPIQQRTPPVPIPGGDVAAALSRLPRIDRARIEQAAQEDGNEQPEA